MTIDLLDFVDSRVTINAHPLNDLVRNAIHMKFYDPKNEIKMKIARDGIQHRLVNFYFEFILSCLVILK